MTARKHWFKVADSVLWDGWSDAELATMIRLAAYLNTRWARDGKDAEDAGSATLDLSSARLICRRTHRADCERALRALGARLTLSVVVVGECFEIKWPKWVIFQGFTNPKPAESRPDAGPSETHTQTPPQDARRKEEESAPSAPESPAAPRPSARRVLVEKPEAFPDESKERLRVWAARKGIGRDLMNAGLEIFRDWTPLKPPYRRTVEQWEGAFKKIVREGVASGMIGKPELKAAAPRYRDADDVIAEAKRKQAEDESRAATESPEEVGRLIDMALRRERA